MRVVRVEPVAHALVAPASSITPVPSLFLHRNPGGAERPCRFSDDLLNEPDDTLILLKRTK
jgi:hypothetical protein